MFFRKTEDISARKFALIIYSSHVPHTSRTAGCKQAVSGPSCHIFRTFSLKSNGRMIVKDEVESILQGIIAVYFEVPSV
jgi:hypothetical protein